MHVMYSSSHQCTWLCVCLPSICMHSMWYLCVTWTWQSWQNSRQMWRNVHTRSTTLCSKQHDLLW